MEIATVWQASQGWLIRAGVIRGAKAGGRRADEKQATGVVLEHLHATYLLDRKGKMESVWWRNLAGTTLTRYQD